MKKLNPPKMISMNDPITSHPITIGRQYCNESFSKLKDENRQLDIVCLYPENNNKNIDIFTFDSKNKDMQMYFVCEKTPMYLRRIYYDLALNYESRCDKDMFIKKFKEKYSKWLCYKDMQIADLK